jgi:hypothetical protein
VIVVLPARGERRFAAGRRQAQGRRADADRRPSESAPAVGLVSVARSARALSGQAHCGEAGRVAVAVNNISTASEAVTTTKFSAPSRATSCSRWRRRSRVCRRRGRTMRGIPGRFLRRQFPNRLPMRRTRRRRITAPSTGWLCAAPRGNGRRDQSGKTPQSNARDHGSICDETCAEHRRNSNAKRFSGVMNSRRWSYLPSGLPFSLRLAPWSVAGLSR